MDHSAAAKIRSVEKSSDLIGIRTRDLPACSIVPQPTTLPRAPPDIIQMKIKEDEMSGTCSTYGKMRTA
jgi:hypothetical protein